MDNLNQNLDDYFYSEFLSHIGEAYASLGMVTVRYYDSTCEGIDINRMLELCLKDSINTYKNVITYFNKKYKGISDGVSIHNELLEFSNRINNYLSIIKNTIDSQNISYDKDEYLTVNKDNANEFLTMEKIKRIRNTSPYVYNSDDIDLLVNPSEELMHFIAWNNTKRR